jgi:hypothetical protein
MLSGAGTSAAEFPNFELMGFPITPHQVAVVGSAHVQEQSPQFTLTLGGMPASPHQVAVLTPRSRPTEAAAALTKNGSSIHSPNAHRCAGPVMPSRALVKQSQACPLPRRLGDYWSAVSVFKKTISFSLLSADASPL